jgi:outer membrane protein assembly factor BamA
MHIFKAKYPRLMRRFVLILICFLCSLGHAADRFTLTRVVVTGSHRYQQSDLVRATGLTVNTQISTEDLQNAANRLGSSGAFASVEYLFKPANSGKGVEAEFQVVDAEKLLSVAFENFVWMSDSELQQAIHETVPLYNGELPSSGSMVDDVSAALTRILAAKGLPSSVSYMLAANFGQAPSAYKFKVDDANVKIRDINLVGASHILPEQLAKYIAPLKGADYLRSDVAIVLSKNLTPVYHAHGYLKFALGEIKPKAEGKDSATLDVTVSEGDQYKLAGYSWTGNTLIPSDELSKQISLKTSQPVDGPQLDQDLSRVRKLFGKFGREGISINPVPTFNGNDVTYSFQVNEGELYHMGKLEIEGMEPEPQRKLMQSWKLAEGEPYDSTYVQQFLSHTMLRVPGHKWSWMTFEQVDDTQKVVNVHLQLKIE